MLSSENKEINPLKGLQSRIRYSYHSNGEGPFKVKALKKFLELKEQQQLLRENALDGHYWKSCPVLAQLIRGVTEACASHQWQDALTLLPCITVRCFPYLPVDYCAQVAAALMGAGLLDSKEMPTIVQAMAPSSMLPLLSRMVQHTNWEELPSQSLLTGTRPTESRHDEDRIRALEEIVRGPNKKLDGVLRNSYRGLLCYLRWRCARDQLELQEACEDSMVPATHEKDTMTNGSQPSVLQQSQVCSSANGTGRSNEVTDGTSDDDDALSDAIAGPSAAELSRQLENVDDVLRQLTSDDGSLIGLAEQAAMLLEPCVQDSVVPCEWLLTPLLEVVDASRGLDASLDVARRYLRCHLQHAPAHRAVLQFVRTHTSKSYVAALHLQLLKNLQRLSPGDESVLVLAEMLIDSPSFCTLKDNDVAVQSDKEDDDYDNFNDDSCSEADTAAPLRHCSLRDATKARSCVTAVRMLVLLLTSPHCQEMLRPWELLHRALTILHSAWLNCWRCRGCKWSRRAVQACVTPWWRLWWAQHHTPQHPSPTDGSAPEDDALLQTIPQAKLAMHRAVVAHILCIDLEVETWRTVLLQNGWCGLANELHGTVNRMGSYANNFERFRDKYVVKSRLRAARTNVKRSPVPGQLVTVEEKECCRLLDQRLGGDSQVAEWAVPAPPRSDTPGPPKPVTPRHAPAPPPRHDVGTPLVCRFVPLLSEDDSDFETTIRQPKKPKIDLRRRQTHYGTVKEKPKPKKSRSEGEPRKSKKSTKAASAASVDDRGSDAVSVADEGQTSAPPASALEGVGDGINEVSTSVGPENLIPTSSSPPARSDAVRQDPVQHEDHNSRGSVNDLLVSCSAEAGIETVRPSLNASSCKDDAAAAAVDWLTSTQYSGPSQDVVPCGQPVVDRQQQHETDSCEPNTDLDLPLLSESFQFGSAHDSPQHDTDVDDSKVLTTCEDLFEQCAASRVGLTPQQHCPSAEKQVVEMKSPSVTTLTSDSSNPPSDCIQLSNRVPDISKASQQRTEKDAAVEKQTLSQNTNQSFLISSPDFIPSSSVHVDDQTIYITKANGTKEAFSSKRNKLALGRDSKKPFNDTDGELRMSSEKSKSSLELGALVLTPVLCSDNVVPGPVIIDSVESDDSEVVPPSPQDNTNFEARHYERCTRLDRDTVHEVEEQRPAQEHLMKEYSETSPDNAMQPLQRHSPSPFEALQLSETVVYRNGGEEIPLTSTMLKSPLQSSDSVPSSPLKEISSPKKSVSGSKKRKSYGSSPKPDVVEPHSCKRAMRKSEDEVALPKQTLKSKTSEIGSRRQSVVATNQEPVCDSGTGLSEYDHTCSSPMKKKLKVKKSKSDKKHKKEEMIIPADAQPQNVSDPDVESAAVLFDIVCEALNAQENKINGARSKKKKKSSRERADREQSSFVETPMGERFEMQATEVNVPSKKKKKKKMNMMDYVRTSTEEHVTTVKTAQIVLPLAAECNSQKKHKHNSSPAHSDPLKTKRYDPVPADSNSQKVHKRKHREQVVSLAMHDSKNEDIESVLNRLVPLTDSSINENQLHNPKYPKNRTPLEQKTKENVPSAEKGLKRRKNNSFGEGYTVHQDQENDSEEPAIIYEQTVSRMNCSSSSNSAKTNLFKVKKKKKEVTHQPSAVETIPNQTDAEHVENTVKRKENTTDQPPLCSKSNAKRRNKGKTNPNDPLTHMLPSCSDKAQKSKDTKSLPKKKKKKLADEPPLFDWINTQNIDDFLDEHYNK